MADGHLPTYVGYLVFDERPTVQLPLPKNKILSRLFTKVKPTNVVCHTGNFSCFGEKDTKGFLYELESIINQRIDENVEGSYTSKLYQRGINKVAQKVGEEAVELVIEAKDNNDDLFKNEAADLLFHFLILLKAKKFKLQDIEEVLKGRH